MTTVQDVFNKTMAIMDEMDESGSAVNEDTVDYQHRSLPIINTLQAELLRYSDTNRNIMSGVRPICPEADSFDDTLGIDDFLARAVLPYGLAYHLLATNGENGMANLCLARYQLLLTTHGGAVPSASENIVDVYGGLGQGSDT